jgi:hypothetical protein
MTVNKRKWTTRLTIVSVILLALSVITLFADLPADTFELGPGGTESGDGEVAGLTNIIGGPLLGPDWADAFDASGNKVVSTDIGAFVIDPVSAGGANDNTVYSGGPSDKNHNDIDEWTWSTSSVPAKDDVANAYAYAKVVAGKLIIFVGVERLDPSGSSHVDVEFFQDVIGLSEPAPCDVSQCTFTGENRNGDLLANLDYTNGGAFGGLSIRKRNQSVRNKYDLVVDLGGQGCNPASPLLPAGTVCAFTNGGPILGGPWPNYNNHGEEITLLETNAFTEFGVNVSDLFPGQSLPCFSTIQVKTRSSQSFTSTLKDFSLHSFQQCTASASTQIHTGPKVGAEHTGVDDIQGTAVPVGTEIHDRMLVTGTPGFNAPTGNVTFTRYATIDCTGTAVGSPEIVALATITGTSNAAAESTSFTTTPGPLSFKAVYAGDSNYPGPVAAACESLTVNRFNSSITTDIRLDTVNGASVLNTALNISTAKTVVDVARIQGNLGGAGDPDPTGTVTFRWYTTGNCSGAFTDEVVNIAADASPNHLDGLKTAVSPAHVLNPSSGVFLSFAVIYSGDGNYNPSVALSCEALCAFPFNAAIP